jgi:hypothetical protein
MVTNRFWLTLSIGMVGLFWGCTSISPRLSQPLFQPTLEDVPRVSTLAHILDGRALDCRESANCEKVYFSRALVSLFENREAARASFRHVIEHNTASPLAGPSELWLQVIETTEDDFENSPSLVLMAQFVREWMERELSERTIGEKPLTPIKTQAEIVDQSRLVLGLQKQLRERDHQLTSLRAQLEALRSIDEDHQQRKVKVPASLRPTEEYIGR